MSKRIKDAFDALPSYWALATLRCSMYALIVAWGMWKAGTNGFSSLSEMTSMQFWQLLGDVLMSIVGVWLAFVDQTLTKVEKRETTNSVTVSETRSEPKPEGPKP